MGSGGTWRARPRENPKQSEMGGDSLVPAKTAPVESPLPHQPFIQF